MELPLQQYHRLERQDVEGRSFNPCFNGTTSATIQQKQKKKKIEKVSILVLMELPLQPLYE